MTGFFDTVQAITEKRLTIRKAKKAAKKAQKKTFKSELLDWLDAIVFAVVVVFLLNQFIFQMFVIPSPSMQNTLMIGDRVWVSKMAYGIELFPYGPKILGNGEVDRDEIITFYNPEDADRSPILSVITKVIYMGTLGFVNLDKSEWLLVKRTAGRTGDTVTFRNGDAYIKASGTGEYVKEADFRSENGYSSAPNRTIEEDTYTAYNAMGILDGLTKAGVSTSNLPSDVVSDYQKLDRNAFFTDYYAYNQAGYLGERMADPSDSDARSSWMKYNTGIYVPEGYILPLGDNRDNSNDGRYFGPIPYKLIIGRVSSIVWPLSRAGSVNGK